MKNAARSLAAVPHWRKYCLTKQTATHDIRLRRACSVVKCLLQNSRRFFPMDFWRRLSVGLATFYEIFYEKSTFFFEEKTNFRAARQHLGFACLFLLFSKLPAGGHGSIFPSIFVAVATSMKNSPLYRKIWQTLAPCYFFHNTCPLPADDKSPALTYTASAAPSFGSAPPNITIPVIKESSHERDQSCRA